MLYVLDYQELFYCTNYICVHFANYLTAVGLGRIFLVITHSTGLFDFIESMYRRIYANKMFSLINVRCDL